MYVQMMSANFLGFLTPPPVRNYGNHSTSLPFVRNWLTNPPYLPENRCHLYMAPWTNGQSFCYAKAINLKGPSIKDVHKFFGTLTPSAF